MESKNKPIISDLDIRHFLYLNFAHASKLSTTNETAIYFGMEISAVENASERLAQEHQVALPSGSHSILMAHPFSGLPRDYLTEVQNRHCLGN